MERREKTFIGRLRRDVAPYVEGYLGEQGYTTLNRFPFYIFNRHVPKTESPELLSPSWQTLDKIDDDEDREFSRFTVGVLVGAFQDVALVGLSISYLAGNDSKLAKIATGVVAAKIGLNVLSYVADKVCSKLWKQYETEQG
jgi:hypothetical protein